MELLHSDPVLGARQAQEASGGEPPPIWPGLVGAAGLSFRVCSASDLCDDLEQVPSPRWTCFPSAR